MTLTHEDYTVGWICALPRELAAARGMLDKEHDDLPAEAIDCNAYVLGRIGSHNVILACLPVGETGVVPAAVTVIRMKSTFRCLEIGLVVGVGGGVPSENHDIRLGDVVVGDGGVIQYDMGKTVQGGRFICTQDRLRPPEALMLAVSKFQAGDRLGKRTMEQYIDEMTSRHPDFSHPGVELDVLYAAYYDHPQEAVSCEWCDPVQRVSRKPRQFLRPVVHYGLIASGNQVMRHGATRDELQAQHDILCFEMEAAGLMREFPSLVIRGICDYADSHKNKAWQDYASVTAAAYAKELLTMIPGPLLRPTGRCFMVPFPRTPTFVGRTDILAMIDNKLQAREPAVLAGIGGVGKTQLAVEYCYSYREGNPIAHVFWVNASTSSNFEQSYREIARALRIPGHDDPKADLKRQIHAHLSKPTADPWLMVLDNMDDGQELGPQMGFVPIARIGPGSIIVTTRDMRVTQYLPDWDHINEDVIAIPSLEIGDARSLVEASLGPGQIANTNDLQDLLEMLGCFPLALTQAVAFIKHNRTTIAKYKSLLDQDNVLGHALLRDVEYRDIRRYDGIPNSILRIRTWEISFDKIQQQDPLAVDILARISIFDAPKGVPESLLYPKDYNEREFTAALGTLLSFSMVAMCPDGSIMMHALVQQAVRWVITSQGTREGFLLEASNRVAVPFTRESMTSWQHLVQLVAHVEEVLCYGSTIGHLGEETLLSRATLLHELASHKGFCCQYDSALVHAQEAYAIRRRALGGTERDTIRSLELVTFILAAQRQYKAAELNQQGVIKARQSVASSEDLATLESQWVLVTILRSSGQLTKALELCNTLKLADETGNILSARAISGLYFLGNELHAVGRIIEAERLYRRVLAESEGKSQVDGDVIKKARIGLNTLLRLSRDDSSACEINFNKIRARSETFGDKHPETIRSLCALGRIYFEQSNWKAAEDAMEQGYRTYMEVLGETHPDTMDSLSELAIIKARQGEFTEAEKLYRRILHQQSTVLGAHHPSTLISKNDLGKVLIELKKYEEARELLKQVIRLECRAWGRSSPVSLDAMQGLVQVQWNLGEFDDAERLCLELIKLVNEDLPTDNITLAGYMEQLAIVLEAQGRYSEAESQWREVVRLNANRDTRLAVTGRMGLGLLAHKQRRLDEAADFYREALAAGQNTEIDQQTMGTLSKFLERALAQQKEEQAAAQEL